MWTDALEPRTTAERLRAARRQETAALYEQSLARRRCSLVREARCSGSTANTQHSAFGEMNEGEPVMDAVSFTARTTATDNTIVTATTSRECSSFTDTYLGRPLKVLSADWSHRDSLQKRSWCCHTGGPHAASAVRAQQRERVSLSPASATTTQSANVRTPPSSHAVAPVSARTWKQTHSSSSSSVSMTRKSDRSKSQSIRASSRRPSTAQVAPRGGDGNGAGTLILSKDYYRRIHQLISAS